MIRRSAAQLVSLAAIFVVAAGFTSMAHAEYTVQLDCHGTNGQPTWASTNDAIFIYTKINNVERQICSFFVVPSNCSMFDDALIACRRTDFPMSKVQSVIVRTRGSDTFWIDKVTLSDPTGQIRWGEDDTTGWCLSTDPADGNSQFCVAGKAASGWSFQTGNR